MTEKKEVDKERLKKEYEELFNTLTTEKVVEIFMFYTGADMDRPEEIRDKIKPKMNKNKIPNIQVFCHECCDAETTSEDGWDRGVESIHIDRYEKMIMNLTCGHEKKINIDQTSIWASIKDHRKAIGEINQCIQKLNIILSYFKDFVQNIERVDE